MAAQVDVVTLLAYLRAPNAFESGNKDAAIKAVVDILNGVTIAPGSSALAAFTSKTAEAELRQLAQDAKTMLPDAQKELAEARQRIAALTEEKQKVEKLLSDTADELRDANQEIEEKEKKIEKLTETVEQLTAELAA